MYNSDPFTLTFRRDFDAGLGALRTTEIEVGLRLMSSEQLQKAVLRTLQPHADV